ncbi:hypothetical protein Pelo_10169 [Pelomyxa schiedti]|nr:hypothetical protein Pelo_10169 [Pelomyxa schiedti]
MATYGAEPLSCFLCHNRFDLGAREPRALNCMHTFCLSCLDQMVRNASRTGQTSIFCPVDQASTTIQGAGCCANFLYKNHSMCSLLAQSGGITCSPGSDVPTKSCDSPVRGIVAIRNVQFGSYIRMDAKGPARGADCGYGIINCQGYIGPWEKFEIVPAGNGTVGFRSMQWNSYIRMDGNSVKTPTGPGCGVVNCQGSLGPWEKFVIVPTSGHYAIRSAEFENCYLRVDGQGPARSEGSGYGIVNCQFGSGPWELFDFVPVSNS